MTILTSLSLWRNMRMTTFKTSLHILEKIFCTSKWFIAYFQFLIFLLCRQMEIFNRILNKSKQNLWYKFKTLIFYKCLKIFFIKNVISVNIYKRLIDTAINIILFYFNNNVLAKATLFESREINILHSKYPFKDWTLQCQHQSCHE